MVRSLAQDFANGTTVPANARAAPGYRRTTAGRATDDRQGSARAGWSMRNNAPLVLLVRAPEGLPNTLDKQFPDGSPNRIAVRRPAPDASGMRMEARMAGKDATEAEAGDHEDSIRETSQPSWS